MSYFESVIATTQSKIILDLISNSNKIIRAIPVMINLGSGKHCLNKEQGSKIEDFIALLRKLCREMTDSTDYNPSTMQTKHYFC